MDILIVKLGALGDVINTLPLAIELKRHLGARIHWITAPLSYPLLDRHEAVDQTILFERRKDAASIFNFLSRLRSCRYDVILDLQRILKSGLIAVAARGSRKIGFDKQRCKEMTWLLPFERIPAAVSHSHMVGQYLEFARYLGVQTNKVRWCINTGAHKPKGLPSRYVVLNIGATKPANRWTAKGFADLAISIRKGCGVACVLTGAPEDAPMADKIMALAGPALFNLTGQTTLLELVDVIDGAAVVVTCDTGPMHLAVALDKKVVALFGPSDHRRTGPYRGKVLCAKLDCTPCNRKKCRKPVCMDAIRAEDVLRLVRPLLGDDEKYTVCSNVFENQPLEP